MSSTYRFRYKKFLFTKCIVAIGHKWNKDSDRMDVYHENGSITSIAEWRKYTLFLGTDWVLFTKKRMEKEAGQTISLNV